ncbi:MAG: signal peptidase I [Promethearchaeota archaeon]|nr:MAG: signal peptidase I [Candidatus Lokiarchaeota archaeon]
MIDSKKRNILKTVLIIVIIGGALLGTYGLACLILNTDTPVTVVEGSSMEPTLYQGDLIFVGKPHDLGTINNGTNGDILIYFSPLFKFLIIHRVIDKYYNDTDHKWYFNTQGDYDGHPDNQDAYGLGGGYLPEDYVKGIMIGRIPWIGNIGIFLRDSGVAIFLIIIILGYLIISTIFESPKPKNSSTSPDNKDTSEEPNGL